LRCANITESNKQVPVLRQQILDCKLTLPWPSVGRWRHIFYL
jgi:hypothetical protein